LKAVQKILESFKKLENATTNYNVIITESCNHLVDSSRHRDRDSSGCIKIQQFKIKYMFLQKPEKLQKRCKIEKNGLVI
jgi:hypothetical protein